jgi:hypothetical protein
MKLVESHLGSLGTARQAYIGADLLTASAPSPATCVAARALATDECGRCSSFPVMSLATCVVVMSTSAVVYLIASVPLRQLPFTTQIEELHG